MSKHQNSLGQLPWQLQSPRSQSTQHLGVPQTACFGTPGLDKIRSWRDRQRRALDLGLSPQSNGKPASFEANQSLPWAAQDRSGRKGDFGRIHPPLLAKGDSVSALRRKEFLRELTTDEHSFSFKEDKNSSCRGINESTWSRLAHPRGDDSLVSQRSFAPNNPIVSNNILNPNKAVLVLDKLGKVCIVNDLACQLLEFSPSQLHGLDFYDDILGREKDADALATTECLEKGNRVLVSGSVVEVQTRSGGVLAASLWLKEVEEDKKLAVLEPVDRTVGKLIFSFDCRLLSMDPAAKTIFQCNLADDFLEDSNVTELNLGINDLLPHVNLDEEGTCDGKLKTTGRTRDGITFPVSVKVRVLEPQDDDEEGERRYSAVVWVFSNVSGLVVLNADGVIESANSCFTNMLFGLRADELEGKKITTLVPGFYQDLSLMSNLIQLGDEDDDEDSELGVRRLEHDLCEIRILDEDDEKENAIPGGHAFHSDEEEEDDVVTQLKHLTSTPAGAKVRKAVNFRSSAAVEFPEGSFFGCGKHKDGEEFCILYQIKRVELEDRSFIYCLWISRDPDEPAEGTKANFSTLTTASSLHNVADLSLGQAIRDAASRKAAASESLSVPDQEDEAQASGDYAKNYVSLQLIGKGAFGYVKAAYRKIDKRMVVTKFIQKSKIHDEYWVSDAHGSRVPSEISLLTTLEHPNIVSVFDIYENEDYFQIVMEKHGSGMDLFEFIDRGADRDEKLNSYIFRQIVESLFYLHSKGILHRDIKDENVIINEHFEIKLIDFGSATFHRPGFKFNTFYGTVEYCSPEVLEGNPYEGPELEMWSLGILLYVLLFSENPFFSIDETLRCELLPPRPATPHAMNLLKSVLVKNPRERFTLHQIRQSEWVNLEVDIKQYKFAEVVKCTEDELYPLHYHVDHPDQSVDSIGGYSGSILLTDSARSSYGSNHEQNGSVITVTSDDGSYLGTTITPHRRNKGNRMIEF